MLVQDTESEHDCIRQSNPDMNKTCSTFLRLYTQLPEHIL